MSNLIKSKKTPSLQFCLIMDLIGCASYAIPGVMEFTDIIWAPISAIIFYKTFGGRVGEIGAVINFVEEILPGTDVIPTFTIAYFYRKYFKE